MKINAGSLFFLAILCFGGCLMPGTAKASSFTISEVMQGRVTQVFINGVYDPKSIEVGNKFVFSYSYTYSPGTGSLFDYTLELFSEAFFYAPGAGPETHQIYSSNFGITWNQSGEYTADPFGTYMESDDGDNNFTFFAPAFLPDWDGGGGTGENMISVTFGRSMWATCSLSGSAFNLNTNHEVFSEFTLRLEANPAPIPEPATFLLFCTGLAGLIGAGKSQRKRRAGKEWRLTARSLTL